MTNRFLATLLLTLPSMVAMVPAVAHSGRTIDVTLTRSGMVPEQIAMQVGERVRLQMTSADGKPRVSRQAASASTRRFPLAARPSRSTSRRPRPACLRSTVTTTATSRARARKGRFVVNSKR